MILLVTIFQGGPVYNEGSSNSSWVQLITVIISLIALRVAYGSYRASKRNSRTAQIAIIQGRLSEKAKEINLQDINPNDHRIWEEKDASISHVVSNIITAKLLIDEAINSSDGYLKEEDKQLLFDQFYLQLHTSIIEYIWENKITESFPKAWRGTFHIAKQLSYCSELFIPSYNKYGNASPPSILTAVNSFENDKDATWERLNKENARIAKLKSSNQ